MRRPGPLSGPWSPSRARALLPRRCLGDRTSTPHAARRSTRPAPCRRSSRSCGRAAAAEAPIGARDVPVREGHRLPALHAPRTGPLRHPRASAALTSKRPDARARSGTSRSRDTCEAAKVASGNRRAPARRPLRLITVARTTASRRHVSATRGRRADAGRRPRAGSRPRSRRVSKRPGSRGCGGVEVRDEDLAELDQADQDRSSWRCVPSAQSISERSPPRRTSPPPGRAGGRRRPAVPRRRGRDDVPTRFGGSSHPEARPIAGLRTVRLLDAGPANSGGSAFHRSVTLLHVFLVASAGTPLHRGSTWAGSSRHPCSARRSTTRA